MGRHGPRGSGLIILSGGEMKAREAAVRAIDSADTAPPLPGWPIQPNWATFVVERYDKARRAWMWDSWHPCRANAQAGMRHIESMGERARHRSLAHGARDRRSEPLVNRSPSARPPRHRFLSDAAAAMVVVRSRPIDAGSASSAGDSDRSSLEAQLRSIRTKLGRPCGAMPSSIAKLRELVAAGHVMLEARRG